MTWEGRAGWNITCEEQAELPTGCWLALFFHCRLMNETPSSATKETPKKWPKSSSFLIYLPFAPVLSHGPSWLVRNMQKPQTEQNANDKKEFFSSAPCACFSLSPFLSPSFTQASPSQQFCSQLCRFPAVRRYHPSGFVLHQKGNGSPPGVTLIAVRSRMVELLLLPPHPSPTGTYTFPTRVNFQPNPPPFPPDVLHLCRPLLEFHPISLFYFHSNQPRVGLTRGYRPDDKWLSQRSWWCLRVPYAGVCMFSIELA